jgi:hypothetical protein
MLNIPEMWNRQFIRMEKTGVHLNVGWKEPESQGKLKIKEGRE